MLHASAEAWTAGDLDGFLADYAEDATFVGSSGIIEGIDQIRATYVRGYWGAGTPEHGLRYRILDVRPVGPSAAVAIGRFELYDRDNLETESTGLFSLTLRPTAEGWKIVHDHSSAG
ncbi:MAG: YybH family protein [Gemmatimonadota bacterium]